MTHAHHAHLHCHDVTVCHGRVPAVHHIDCHFGCGQFVAVVGPNGAGKSTFLKAVVGWLPLTTGSIEVGGVAATRCLQRIAYLSQQDQLDARFPATVQEVVSVGRYPRLGWWRGFRIADHKAVIGAMREMGIDHLADRPVAALSGGQRHRVLLARALASGADVFLLDEPLAGLDQPGQHDLMERLASWRQRDRLVLAVLHDLDAARRWCSHALVLDRHLVAAGPVAEALAGPVLTRAFHRAIDGGLRDGLRYGTAGSTHG